MAGDRYCVSCGVDLLRSYDPPIECDACEATRVAEAACDERTKALRAKLDQAGLAMEQVRNMVRWSRVETERSDEWLDSAIATLTDAILELSDV